jgi:hypothetical protein
MKNHLGILFLLNYPRGKIDKYILSDDYFKSEGQFFSPICIQLHFHNQIWTLMHIQLQIWTLLHTNIRLHVYSIHICLPMCFSHMRPSYNLHNFWYPMCIAYMHPSLLLEKLLEPSTAIQYTPSFELKKLCWEW